MTSDQVLTAGARCNLAFAGGKSGWAQVVQVQWPDSNLSPWLCKAYTPTLVEHEIS